VRGCRRLLPCTPLCEEEELSISAAIGTALGLILVFALFALFCSGIVEAISNLLQKRARYLLVGLRSMLDRDQATVLTSAAKDRLHDKVRTPASTQAARARVRHNIRTAHPEPADGGSSAAKPEPAPAPAPAPAPKPTPGPPSPANDDLTTALFQTSLLRSLQTPRTFWLGRRKGRLRNPQYIAPQMFTRALLATLLPEATPAGSGGSSVLRDLDKTLSTLDGFPATESLRTLIMQAEGDLQRFEKAVEGWYDEQMSRIAGWYKQWSKVMLGLVGFVIAVLANVDAVQVAHALYVNEPVRQAVVAAAQNGSLCEQSDTTKQRATCAGEQLTALKATSLPVWYSGDCRPFAGHPAACFSWTAGSLHGWDYPVKLLGWILTAFAVSFGAPFWFDALSRLGSLRNTGPKPEVTPAGD
jgi:hypothetical protein